MRNWGIIGSLSLVALMACLRTEMPQATEGASLYQKNCAICHGADARGNGEIAGSLPVPPTDLTLIARRSGGKFDRAEVLSKIDGYSHKPSDETRMPEFGALLAGDLVPLDVGDGVLTPTPRPLAALLAYLEAIQR